MSTPDVWPAMELLAEPTRRTVYDVVRQSDRPLTRDEVAERAQIGGRLAAFHLERLTDGGLLAFDYSRPPGVGGPGAGRPAKRYWPSDVRLAVTVPPRRFELAARILAATVAGAPRSVTDAAMQQASEVGREVGQAYRAGRGRDDDSSLVSGCLEAMGYEPSAGHDRLTLRNCPFHEVADSARDVVCAMNLGLLRGALEGLVARNRAAEQVPAPPGCCVAIVQAPPASRSRRRLPGRRSAT